MSLTKISIIIVLLVIISNVRTNKIGTCPPNDNSLITTCQVLCNNDTECSGIQKCCQFGCQRKCLDPILTSTSIMKPGNCPKLEPNTVGTCIKHCNSDFDCTQKSYKCCSNGCGTVCSAPIECNLNKDCSFFKRCNKGICKYPFSNWFDRF
ncbi:unnamed protein product [Brachionus calyciflorus]|uniref:WAP domain-containing protein n=1 Tax=Brachionus calyciflorus TaxID=104777 RepID=A0A813W9G6_9BILA|nr:unnamed protein product [Brachionus calyciflorus]